MKSKAIQINIGIIGGYGLKVNEPQLSDLNRNQEKESFNALQTTSLNRFHCNDLDVLLEWDEMKNYFKFYMFCFVFFGIRLFD